MEAQPVYRQNLEAKIKTVNQIIMSELNLLREDFMEPPAELFLKESLAAIRNLEQVNIASLSFNNIRLESKDTSLLKIKNKGFKLEIKIFIEDTRKVYNINFVIDSRNYLAEDVIIYQSIKKGYTNDDGVRVNEFLSKLHLNSFATEDFDNGNSFYRLIIKAPGGEISNFIHGRGFKCNDRFWADGMLNLSIDSCKIKLYNCTEDDQKYFVIDATEKVDFKVFTNLCHAVLIGYGFLSGDFHQNEGYYIKSDDNKFSAVKGISYRQFRPSILTNGSSNPIFGLAIGYTDDPAIQQKYGYFLSTFTEKLFSKLCDKIFSEADYAALLLLIIETNATSLILRPAGYSVALEKITNIIVKQNDGLKPITDKALSRRFRNEIKTVLEKYREEIEKCGNTDSISILTKNIDGLNNPTNRDKLTKPFTIYNINLGKDEIDAIDKRNSFLHGRPLEIQEDSDELIEIYAISLRLNKLVNKLILKHIGFDGYIVNHLKHKEGVLKKIINEDLFELI